MTATTLTIGRYTNLEARQRVLDTTRLKGGANLMMSSVLKLAKSAVMASRRH